MWILFFVVIVVPIEGQQMQGGQALIDYIGSSLSLQIGVVSNFDKDPSNYVPMRLILNNTGDMIIPNGHWKIYFSCLYGAKIEDLDCGLSLAHVNGDLFYLSPKPKFLDLPPGYTVSCTWHQRLWNIDMSDFFPNWFVSSDGLFPRVIESTRETFSFLLPYDTPEKWKRSREDVYNPFTPQERFEIHRFKSSKSKRTSKFQSTIVPTPLNIVVQDTEIIFSHDEGWTVENSTDFPKVAKYLADMAGLTIVNISSSKKYVQFIKDTSAIEDEEAYFLNVTIGKIIITSRDTAGAFYGVQSLLSLLQHEERRVLILDIYDKPRFSYRGLMIDTARSFKPKEWIFQLLDVMAMYKLNKLHLHLSDDGAWRLEIQDIPELTEVGNEDNVFSTTASLPYGPLMGSNRCLRSDISPCLLPQRGSGPDNATSGSGYYSIEDYRDILRYAADRHITVIPEFDMPGHSRASVASMAYRDTKLYRSVNLPSYQLSDVDVQTSVTSQQHWIGNVMNPCYNTTYAFVKKILDEVIRMHKGIMALEIFHLGGDEVAEGVLDDAPACQHLSGPKDTKSLKRYFVKRVADILANKGLDVAAWEDGVYADGKPNPINDFISRNVYSYVWFNNWEKGRGNRSALFADAGYKVILNMATHLYFDHAQEPDPQEMGLYWATRYINTEKVHGFMPDDIFANADADPMGHPMDLKKLCENNWCPKTTKPENVIGIQVSMFSDQIRNKQQMHSALFPRLIAMAERVWHKAPWESVEDKTKRDADRRADWERMVDILGNKELPRLEKMGIDYRIPPPGARLQGDVLKMNTLYPNHEVMMSLDGGTIWQQVQNNSLHLPAGTHKIHLKTISPFLRRTSRVIVIDTNTLTGEHEKDQSQSQETSNIGTTSGGRLWLQVVSIFFILLSDLKYTEK